MCCLYTLYDLLEHPKELDRIISSMMHYDTQTTCFAKLCNLLSLANQGLIHSVSSETNSGKDSITINCIEFYKILPCVSLRFTIIKTFWALIYI